MIMLGLISSHNVIYCTSNICVISNMVVSNMVVSNAGRLHSYQISSSCKLNRSGTPKFGMFPVEMMKAGYMPDKNIS